MKADSNWRWNSPPKTQFQADYEEWADDEEEGCLWRDDDNDDNDDDDDDDDEPEITGGPSPVTGKESGLCGGIKNLWP